MKTFIRNILLLQFIIAITLSTGCRDKKDENVIIKAGDNSVVSTFYSPKGSVYRPNNIVVSFNSPMVPISTLGEINSDGPIILEPEVKGSYHWLGTKSVSFVPDKPFPFASRFKVEIAGDTVDVNGNGLASPINWEFETARPQLMSSIPHDGAVNVDINENILLKFNQPVDPDVVAENSKFLILLNENESVEIDASFKRPDKEILKDHNIKEERAVLVRPSKKLSPSSKIKLVISEKLKGMEGPLTSQKDFSLSFETFGPLKVKEIGCTTNCNPKHSILLEFTNQVIPSDVIKKMSITPGVEIENDSDWATNYFYIYGDFDPSTEYRILLSTEIEDIHKNKLGRQETFTYKTSDYEPKIDFVNDYGVLSQSNFKDLTVGTVNVDRLDVKIKNISKDDLVEIITKEKLFNKNMVHEDISFDKNMGLEIKSDPNKKVFTKISSDKLLDVDKESFYLIEVSSPQVVRKRDKESFRLRYRSIIQITNIGITAKVAESGEVTIWATSLDSGAPISDCKIELRDSKNEILWSGVTSEKGTAKSTKIKTDEVFILAESGDSNAFSRSDWNRGFSPWDFGFWQSFEPSKLRSFLFTERGIYQPGEIIYFKAIVRELTDDGISYTDKKKGTIKAYDGRGRRIFKKSVKLNEYGTVAADIEIPEYAATGYGSVTLDIITGETTDKDGKKDTLTKFFRKSINIAEYKPAKFKVTVDIDEDNYVAGEKIDFKVNADYLFGSPLKGRELEWNISTSPSYFQPEKYENFTFGRSNYLEEEKQEFGILELEGRQRAKLNNDGKFSYEVPTDANKIKNTTNYVIEATVTDVNDKSISSRSVTKVHPGNFYIGINIPSFIIEANKEFKANLIAVTRDEKLLNENIDVTLYKKEWHSSKKKAVVGYKYETKTSDEKISECSVDTGAEADSFSQCTFTPKSPGLHFIRAKGRDNSGNNIVSTGMFYVTGSGYAGWKPEDSDRIELIKDKKEYAPGDIAGIMIKSPFNNTNAFITLERNGIIHSEIQELVGNTPVVRIPIEEKYVPNIYFSVVLINRPEDIKSEGNVDNTSYDFFPEVKVGYLELPVTAKSKKLNVKVETDKEIASPGDNINVKINVADHKNNPIETEISVMAVDVGSLILTGYETPNPFDIFYSKTGLGVTTSDNRIYIIDQRSFGKKGEPVGGGGGPGSGMRSRFMAVPYWNPSVITDKNGNAEINFDLPDNISAFRIMAVASTVDQFGSGDSKVVSKKPLIISPSLPNFLSVGDSFSAGAILHNESDKNIAGTLSIESDTVTITGRDEKRLNIQKGEEQEILFNFEATKKGTAEIRFMAKSDKFSDAITKIFPVKIAYPKEVFTTYGEVETLSTEKIEPIENVYPDFGGLDIRLAPTALDRLTDSALYLVDYPYECIEQKVSKGIGAMFYSKIETSMDKDRESVEKYRNKVRKIIFELYKYQRWDGSFSYWPGGSALPYLSVYTVQFLNLAKEHGYIVDKVVHRRGIDYIKKLLRKKEDVKSYEKAYYYPLKAYALYVLASAGESEEAYYEELFGLRQNLSISTEAQLVMAMKLDDYSADFYDDYLTKIDNNLEITAGEAHVKESVININPFVNNFYTNAYVLKSLLMIKPDHPLVPKIARYLMNGSENGRWIGTYSSAAVLISLYDYLSQHESERPKFSSIVKLGTDKLMETSFNSRGDRPKEIKLPISKLTKLNKAQDISFEKEGKGILYYRTSLKYATDQFPVPPREEGFTISKKITPFRSEEFRRGELIKVQLNIIVPSTRNYVVIKDSLPAGFEAINFSLETVRKLLNEEMSNNMPINNVEIYNDRVLLFSDMLPSGSYEYTYLAKGIAKGDFIVPPAHVEEMYNPEVFGRSISKEITIK